jgi:hypothetical protein
MAERQSDPSQSFFVPDDQALIGVVIRQQGRNVTRFCAHEAAADAALAPWATDEERDLAGSWVDLLWDDLADGLDRRLRLPEAR